jgi:predicted SAM-dependent methyltransferase
MKCKGTNIQSGKKLNLGCGYDFRKDWVNIDNNKRYKADIYHDLDKFPYPLPSNHFDSVLMQMILEHLDKPERALKEVVRVCKRGAKLVIIVPHATSYANFTDMQHKSNFTEHSFNEDMLEEYGLVDNLKLTNKSFLILNKWKKYLPFKNVLKIFFNGIYDDLKFEFEVKK